MGVGEMLHGAFAIDVWGGGVGGSQCFKVGMWMKGRSEIRE